MEDYGQTCHRPLNLIDLRQDSIVFRSPNTQQPDNAPQVICLWRTTERQRVEKLQPGRGVHLGILNFLACFPYPLRGTEPIWAALLTNF